MSEIPVVSRYPVNYVIARESPRARIFLTGRPHAKEAIQRYFAKAVAISVHPNQGDIKNYLEMRLERDEEPDAMNNDLRANIVRTILEKMSDMCVREFGASLLSAMYKVLTNNCVQISSCYAKYRCYPRRDDNSSEKKET